MPQTAQLARRFCLVLAVGLVAIIVCCLALYQRKHRGDMNFPRMEHTATLLPNGEVLVTGGLYELSLIDIRFWIDSITARLHGRRFAEKSTYYRSCEIYNPTTHRWRMAASLANSRSWASAVLLSSGKVLLVGPGDNSTCELYDYKTDSWSLTGKIAYPRDSSHLLLLPNGHVLMFGGFRWDVLLTGKPGAAYLSQLEEIPQYNPKSETWDTGAPVLKYLASALIGLKDGKILVVGGSEEIDSTHSKRHAECEIYDPSTGTSSPTGSLVSVDHTRSLTVLPDGRVLSVSPLSCEIYDPKAGTWKKVAVPTTDSSLSSTLLLKSGLVLLFGGQEQCELYDPVRDKWTLTGNMKIAREFYSTATLLNDGQVLVTGGEGNPMMNVLSACELYDPATGTWSFP